MPVLDIQRRSQQIGRIRIGQQVRAANGKMRPDKLDTFRFTTPSRDAAEAVAALYGGEARPWENQGRGEWEVITGVSEIMVTVPPRDAVISQWYEMWNKGGCVRRCDSQIERISGKPCMCPHADDPSDAEEVERAALERAALSKLNPPKACGLVTRISVMIPDLPGIGVFRLDTGSFYAAGESGDKAALLEMARARNVFLPAKLRIEQRSRVADGKTTRYPVPVLEILSTFRDIATGALEAAGIAAQLPPAPGEERLAIAAPPTAPAPAATRAPRAKPAPERDAQKIADDAGNATTREEVKALADEAEALGVAEDFVCVDRDADIHEELRSHLRETWRKLPVAEEGSAA